MVSIPCAAGGETRSSRFHRISSAPVSVTESSFMVATIGDIGSGAKSRALAARSGLLPPAGCLSAGGMAVAGELLLCPFQCLQALGERGVRIMEEAEQAMRRKVAQ